MFGRMMNNYYYGKSGKGDFRKEDLPTTRSQLFRDTLRTRFAGLVRLNLLYCLIWIPAMIVIYIFSARFYTTLNDIALYSSGYSDYLEWAQNNDVTPMDAGEFRTSSDNVAVWVRDYDLYVRNHPDATRAEFDLKCADQPSFADSLDTSLITPLLLFLFPCIAITGPFTAGLSYVTRNWARDEHAFIWSDFRDAVKSNWKYPLVISTITGFLPLAVYVAWGFYGELGKQNPIMCVPQIVVAVLGALWAISVTYMHPLTISYDLKLKDVIRNGFILGVGRLPFSIGIRLLHCVPLLAFLLVQYLFNMDLMLSIVILGVYYILIGFSLSRFITASYTNMVFDRFINNRIEGAKVNRGLQETDDDYDDDEDEEDAGQEQEESSGSGKE